MAGRRVAAPPHGAGFNTYSIRTAKALWQDIGLEAKRISGTYLFADTQMEGVLDESRHIIHKGNIAEYLKDPESVHNGAEAPPPGLTHIPRIQLLHGCRGPAEVRLGHGYRPERLHRLHRLRGGVPGGK